MVLKIPSWTHACGTDNLGADGETIENGQELGNVIWKNKNEQIICVFGHMM